MIDSNRMGRTAERRAAGGRACKGGPARGARRVSVLLVLAAGAPAAVAPVAAQTADSPAGVVFDIPAQPLDAALARYFRLTGVQLLYDSATTAGRSSSPLRGRYPPREALRLMLAGTGLRVRYSKSNAAIILAAGAGTPSSLIPLGRVVVRGRAPPHHVSPLERLAYYDMLERVLRGRLQVAPATARLSFRIVLDMTIGATGAITALRIDRGTGHAPSDALIVATLRTGAVPPPPEGLEQPLLVALAGTRRD